VICECGTAAPIKGNELAESVSLDCFEILRVLSLLLMGCRIYVKKEKVHVSLDFYFILFLLSHLRELHLGSQWKCPYNYTTIRLVRIWSA
jgi:hypothetical protein